MVLKNSIPENSSYKDPDAVVFIDGNKIYRKIYKPYIKTFNHLMQSGLYTKLTEEKLLIPHKIIEENDDYIIIEPQQLFISYPWEWCFSKIKDAALATLEIQRIALDYNMSLKDANYFNIQFCENTPMLIDTTSFEEYQENEAWIAYRQFCENFITVLSLMSESDIRLKGLILSHIEGIPLDLASKLLPFKTKFNLGIFMHIHMHAKMQNKYSGSGKIINNTGISKEQLKIFIDNLYNTVQKFNLSTKETEWNNYYSFTNYSEGSFEEKKRIVKDFYEKVKPDKVIDFGANTGVFSRLFTNSIVYSLDIDELAVEQNYKTAKDNRESNIIPLVYDIANPSPSVGFENKERVDFLTRTGPVDMVSALALMHHLRISYNIPFKKQAEFFSAWGKYLVIEYVDKKDTKVENMLLNRTDVFEDYNIIKFEEDFSNFYKIIEKKTIGKDARILYLMERI